MLILRGEPGRRDLKGPPSRRSAARGVFVVCTPFPHFNAHAGVPANAAHARVSGIHPAWSEGPRSSHLRCAHRAFAHGVAWPGEDADATPGV